MLSVLTSLNALATGNHEITYAVLVDEDDPDTVYDLKNWCDLGRLPGVVPMVDSGKLINARFNDACRAHPADWYVQMCDDSFPLTQNWDDLVHGASRVLPAFGIQDINDPDNITYPTVGSKWFETLGRFYPEYFPFWFADTWIAEVFGLAFAKPFPIVNQLQIGGKRGQTHGMRELEFWFRFFAVTRGERIEEAKAIASAWGFTVDPLKDRIEQLAQMEANDLYQIKRVPLYEKVYGANAGEESAVYKAAEAKAKKWIEDHSAKLAEAA
jgi:hypothetical protein